MNPKSSPLGSIWRRWDLHFHTPSSYDYQNKSVNNEDIVAGLMKAAIEVVAVTDHHRIDPDRIVNLQRLAGDAITVLPGIEFRSELGGSEFVHYIGVFPETCNITELWTKLSGKLDITDPDVQRAGDEAVWCPFEKASNVIHELGGLVSVHAGKKANSIENMSNSDNIKRIIKKEYVEDGLIDFLEIGRIADERNYQTVVLPHLRRKIPVIICSDNHDIGNYAVKCPLWIKGDRTFESLRQTLYEPQRRVTLSVNKPITPLLAIRKVDIDFPAETELLTESGAEQRSDKFCFRGKTQVAFSPYLTCLIGGRGSGKSTLLNLIHEKLEPGKTKFFADNSLAPAETAAIASCVSIDGDTELKVVEFLQQNEIEQFATAPLGFTDAIFNRLAKLDMEGKLAAVEAELLPAVIDTSAQADRLKAHDELIRQIATAEKEHATAKALIASFENDQYKAINTDLGNLNKELQGLRNWRSRLETLIKELRLLRGKQNFPRSENPNPYEAEFFAVLKSIDEIAALVQGRPNLATAALRQEQLSGSVATLKQRLEGFLKGRGLSQENSADVGKANERVAQIEQELPALKAREADLAAQIAAFSPRRDLTAKRAATVTGLLEPLNKTLSELGNEVRAIELRYGFDESQFDQAITNHIQVLLGANAPRIDHVRSMLEDVGFANLTTRQDFVSKLPERQATAKLLREYFSVPLNFELLKVEAEKRLMDFGAFGRIRVSYDGKPVESSSFGQRCTTAIVVLLLLGNTPIVIDEPEAHLDSALIANYLVELVKTTKLNRQIIFATHNANFVVNGDAELIHALEMGNDKVTKIQSITIEDLQHREKLLALEGGPEAFHKREHRYGFA
jgi:ABC-type lipoprotein export system ATPase subunit